MSGNPSLSLKIDLIADLTPFPVKSAPKTAHARRLRFSLCGDFTEQTFEYSLRLEFEFSPAHHPRFITALTMDLNNHGQTNSRSKAKHKIGNSHKCDNSKCVGSVVCSLFYDFVLFLLFASLWICLFVSPEEASIGETFHMFLCVLSLYWWVQIYFVSQLCLSHPVVLLLRSFMIT